eukprot:2973777-Amphidinium_carterae.1
MHTGDQTRGRAFILTILLLHASSNDPCLRVRSHTAIPHFTATITIPDTDTYNHQVDKSAMSNSFWVHWRKVTQKKHWVKSSKQTPDELKEFFKLLDSHGE